MARVLITGFCAIPGAHRVGVQLRHVVRAIRAQHHLELLIAREGEQAYVERMGGVRTLRVPIPEASGGVRAQGEALQRALRRQLDGAEYDIIHCRDGWTAQVVRQARERAGFAMVYDLTRAPLGDLSGRVVAAAQEEGLVLIECGAEGNVVRFIPPMVTSDEDLNLGLARLEAAVAHALG